jgi:excisionase family DNA binding protein
MTPETYYTLDEAAALVKLHPQTLRRWIRQGKLTAKRFGKQLRLRWQDLERAARSVGREAEEQSHFEQLALASLADLWDNEADAVYDNWKELYDVKKR